MVEVNSEDPDCRACHDIERFLRGFSQGRRVKAKPSPSPSSSSSSSPTPSPPSSSAGESAPRSSFSDTSDKPNEKYREIECPLDRAELGRNSWSVLHTMAAYYPTRPTSSQQHAMSDFMSGFARFYPCVTCRSHLINDLRSHPPITSNRTTLSQWMCQLHNRVNKRLGKKEFDCSRVDERWRTGPPDGSCD